MKHLNKAIVVAVLASTTFSVAQAATPYMTVDQYNAAVQQQQEAYRKAVEEQRAQYQKQVTAQREAAEKQRAQYQKQVTAQREAAEKQRAAIIKQTQALRKQYAQNFPQQPAFTGLPVPAYQFPQPVFSDHSAQFEKFAEAQRKQMESIAERTREAFEKQATVQQDRLDEYMLSTLPVNVKERVMKAQEEHNKVRAEMDAKRAEIEKKSEEHRKAIEARLAELHKQA